MSIYQSTKVSPYVYQLTHKTTGQFYIGYREVNKVPSDQDLGFFYWTSSKNVKPIFSEFNIQILAEFFDGDSAWYQEQRIIEANIKNPLCLNHHYVKDGQRKFSMAGIPKSPETLKRMSAWQIGRTLSAEHCQNIALSKMGIPNTEEQKLNISRSLIGKHMPKDMYTDQWRRLQRESHLGRKDNQETFLRKSIAQSGENNPRSKTWTLLKESDNTIFEVKSLKPWCRSMDISYDGIGKTKTTGKFYKGYQILSN